MKRGVDEWFQVKNDQINHPFLLKAKRLPKKKLRENETRVFSL